MTPHSICNGIIVHHYNGDVNTQAMACSAKAVMSHFSKVKMSLFRKGELKNDGEVHTHGYQNIKPDRGAGKDKI